MDAEKIRKLLSAPYYDATTHRDTGEDPSQILNETDSSTIMNETFISTKSNDSATSTRPSSRNSWRFWDYRLFRNEQKRREMDFEQESKSTRRNKYKSKIDRAKQNYLQQQQQQQRPSSEYGCPSEDGEKRMPVHVTRLPEPPPVTAFRVSPQPQPQPHLVLENELKLHPPIAKYDSEYESIVRKAEENWSSYKKRLDKADLYAKSRAFSTGVLETNLDTGRASTVQKSILETDLDQVQNDIERESRKKIKEGALIGGYRAKSADCAMDKKKKLELQPPENELRKLLLNDSSEQEEKNLSEHELRFRKSIEKLQVPDWYLYSEYFARSLSPPKAKRHAAGEMERSKSTQVPEKRWSRTDFGDPKASAYGNRWPYARIWNQDQAKNRDYRSDARKSDHLGLKIPEDFYLPKGFFEKYKDEIEEMRKSRSKLSKSMEAGAADQYGARRPVPVATVRPTQVQDEYEEIRSSDKPVENGHARSNGVTGQNGWAVPKVSGYGKFTIEVASEMKAGLPTTRKCYFGLSARVSFY